MTSRTLLTMRMRTPPRKLSVIGFRALLTFDGSRSKRSRTAAQMKAREHHHRNIADDGTITPQKVGRINRQMEKKVVTAQVNYSRSSIAHNLSKKLLTFTPDIFQDFSFNGAANRRANPKPATATVWDDNIPRSAQSADGVNMAFYIPNFMSPSWTVRITFISVYKLLLIELVAHPFRRPYALRQIQD